MKKILIMIAMLPLVSCNKVEKNPTYDKWLVYDSYSRNSVQEDWVQQVPKVSECKITKDSWEPLIPGKCSISEYGGFITLLDNPDGFNHSYSYSSVTDEIKYNIYKTDGTHIWKYFLKRK